MTKATKAPATTQPTFMELVEAVTPARIKTAAAKLAAEYTERQRFQAEVAPSNTKIQAKLTSQAKVAANKDVVAVLIAAEVPATFINATRGDGATQRFNVYAIDKMHDLIKGINAGHISNAVNACVVQSMIAFEEAGVDFTSKHAMASVSGDIDVDPASKKLLKRHTASASTAPTQQSSTMAALRRLGAVENKGSTAKPVWKFTNAPIVERLKQIASAKPAPVAA